MSATRKRSLAVETRAAKRARIPSIAITDLVNNVDLFFYAFIAYLTVLDVHRFSAVFNYKKRPHPHLESYSLTEVWLAVVPNEFYPLYVRHNPTLNSEFCYNETLKEVEIGGSFEKVSMHMGMYYRGMPLFNECNRFIDGDQDSIRVELLTRELLRLDKIYSFDTDLPVHLEAAVVHFNILERINQHYRLRVVFSYDNYHNSDDHGYWPGVIVTEYTKRDSLKDIHITTPLLDAARKWCDHAEKVHNDIINDIEKEALSLIRGTVVRQGTYWRVCKRPGYGWWRGDYYRSRRGGVLAVEFRADKFTRFDEEFNFGVINELVGPIVDRYDTFHLGVMDSWACDQYIDKFKLHVEDRFRLFCDITKNAIVVSWDTPPDTTPFRTMIRHYNERFLRFINLEHFIRMWIFRNGPLRFSEAKTFIESYENRLDELEKEWLHRHQCKSLLPTEL